MRNADLTDVSGADCRKCELDGRQNTAMVHCAYEYTKTIYTQYY